MSWRVGEREAGVDDVLDDDHIAAVERRIEILQQADFAGGGRALGVARHRHEIHRHVAGRVADEIRQEHERAFEHRDDVKVVGEVSTDLQGERLDPFLNLVGRE
jgi:hypothetical protein